MQQSTKIHIYNRKGYFPYWYKNIIIYLYKTSGGDGLSFRSKPDLRQRHKQAQTQTYPFVDIYIYISN